MDVPARAEGLALALTVALASVSVPRLCFDDRPSCPVAVTVYLAAEEDDRARSDVQEYHLVGLGWIASRPEHLW